MDDNSLIQRQSSSYCAEIDYWRMIFACIIAMYHFTSFGHPDTADTALFGNGWIATEFFFLVSGYLLAIGAARRVTERRPIVAGALTLWLDKWKRFFPYVLSVYIVLWCVMGIYAGFQKMLGRLPLSFGELSLLYMSGVGRLLQNSPTWYLSALLICSVICYPLLHLRFDRFTQWIAPVAAVAILVWVSRRDAIVSPFVWEGVTYRGTIRGLGCMLLGCSCYPVVEWIKQKQWPLFARWGMLGLELLCFATVLYIAQMQLAQDWYLEAVALLCTGMIIAFSKKSPLSGYFPIKPGKWLGEFSLSLFCSHWIVRYILSHFAKNEMSLISSRRANVYALIISLIVALVMMYWVRLLNRFAAKIKAGSSNNQRGESKRVVTGF